MTYLDAKGRLRWTRDGEGRISYYSYHTPTGGLAYIAMDVKTDSNAGGLPTEIANGSTGLWDAWGSTVAPTDFQQTGNALGLVTKMEFDAIGRSVKSTDPMGIGLTGSPEAIPTLTDSLELGRYVTREAALALSFCNGHNATDKLLAGLNNTKANPTDRALLARCLGELLANERPSRLTRLTANSNYDMRIPRLTTYRAFANEFLFTYLLAPTPDEWETLCPE